MTEASPSVSSPSPSGPEVEHRAGARRRILAVTPSVFGGLMVLNGLVDLFRPEAATTAMDELSMPHYLLGILGVAKIAGGACLLAPVPPLLREWAFAGFSVWCVGGVACHLLSGHGVAQLAPILALGVLLVVSYCGARSRPGAVARP